MKKTLVLIFASLAVLACNKLVNDIEEETYTKGKAEIFVDESILPIVEDEEMVFENQFPKAFITLQPKSEAEIVNAILEKKCEVAVLSRPLSKKEEVTLQNKKIYGKSTHFASDAIALIVKTNFGLEKISTEEFFKIFKSEKNNYQLVFDNENSSCLNYFMQRLNLKNLPKSITALKNNLEVVNFVAKNENSIGVVGVNWLLNPSIENENLINNVKVLAVGNSIENAVKPSQSYIETEEYPFVRKIYLINYQGRNGLGMGFASFVKNDVGQRIVLKSGLAPMKIPTREIRIVKNNKNKK